MRIGSSNSILQKEHPENPILSECSEKSRFLITKFFAAPEQNVEGADGEEAIMVNHGLYRNPVRQEIDEAFIYTS